MKAFIIKLIKWRFIRYLISGGSANATNIILLFVLVHFFNVWYLLATVVSFIVAVYVSFVTQKLFTFNDYTKEKVKQQAVLYFGTQIFNLCFNTLFMYISVDILGAHYLLSQVFILGTIGIYNFFIYKHVVFYPNAPVEDKRAFSSKQS